MGEVVEGEIEREIQNVSSVVLQFRSKLTSKDSWFTGGTLGRRLYHGNAIFFLSRIQGRM